jgi:iron(III) transport system substrate-binding protein
MARRVLIVVWALLVVVMVLEFLTFHSVNPSSPEGRTSSASKVVLYCGTDREIAQDLIDQFAKETGIQVEAKFDTEAAKSVGLVQAIRQEKAHPQCDVFWGGGAFFCTILDNDGCLAPAPNDLIQAEGAAPILTSSPLPRALIPTAI